MKKVITNEEVIFSLFWKFVERIGNQSISFIVQIILARLLEPKDFGLISLILIFINIANIFIDSGFNAALIQRKDIELKDFSTVFYFSLLISGVLYTTLFFTSPIIARFYGYSDITRIIRVLSVVLFIGPLTSILNALISRQMQFKKLFINSMISNTISGFIGIIAAYNGLGVWSLVLQQLLNKFLLVLTLVFTLQWKPSLSFSKYRLKVLLDFGWKILVTNLLGNIFLNVRGLIIGKIYTTEMLGFYNRGMQFPNLIINNIDGSIQTVMLPTYASKQENRQKLKNMVRRSIKTSSYIIFPMMIGMAALADSMVTLILTKKWLPSVPFLQIYCFIYAFMPIHTSNIQAIKALGHSETILKLEIIKKIIDVITLLITTPRGIFAIAVGELITSLISTFINSYPNKKYIDYSFYEQWMDILPPLILSLFMGCIVYFIKFLAGVNWIMLIFQIIIGIFIYLALSRIFRIEELDYLLNTFKKIVKKN